MGGLGKGERWGGAVRRLHRTCLVRRGRSRERSTCHACDRLKF